MLLISSFPQAQHDRVNSSLRCPTSCSNSISDMELAMDLEKMKRQTVETQEAMKRSRKVLYAELCLYLGLGKEELRRKWERMEEDDKWVLAEEFVSDWGSNFHPLSAKELVDQHLFHDVNKDSSSVYLFSGLKKLMGFPDP
ncbi:hypothetical protein L1987_39826 [Smallanthus sonchifolius]|uniref:Uncharacterized protein n=1 Tax=Smallanthus sonchifolius TaxID=185202 RepID=A0ACB9GT58_9ASTR|nr:hypothetical protein L1987_39826 [Smallanthus sonchifolius]